MQHPLNRSYCGRLAPTPTGGLHMGHGRTFFLAWQRAREAGGQLRLRIEDLDPQRCKPEYIEQFYDDLNWMGVDWDGEVVQQRACREFYLAAWRALRDGDFIYPCTRSRKDLRSATQAPHEEDEGAEPLYPPEWRPAAGAGRELLEPVGVNWRFRVPDGEAVEFVDALCGPQRLVAGEDFGDFVVWRRDDVPAYELAVGVDDARMEISEVVRGEDLLRSTARQLLLYRALGLSPPAWYHTPLVRDADGRRLAKRHAALEMKTLREAGRHFEDCLAELEG